jgi:hypothetical protein
MSNSNTLQALAERCEQASGPDREINKDILLALGYSWRGMNYWHSDDNRAWEGSISFTASLDAALKLVPDGWRWAVSTTNDDPPCAFGHPPDKSFWIEDTPAATPALALCAFALRARAAIDAPHDP